MFWVLGTGAQWRELPEKHQPYQTSHRRFQESIDPATDRAPKSTRFVDLFF
jgi:hypothetical protein